MGKAWVAFIAMLLAVAAWRAASAAAAPKRVPSDMADVDLILSCEAGPIAKDYSAETASGVPLSGSYAAQRGANKGLVTLMSQGEKRVMRYVVPRRLIREVVHVAYDMAAPDRADLIFTADRLDLVHTSARNAGIFVVSVVYEMPLSDTEEVGSKLLKDDAQLARMLAAGLSFRREGGCASP